MRWVILYFTEGEAKAQMDYVNYAFQGLENWYTVLVKVQTKEAHSRYDGLNYLLILHIQRTISIPNNLIHLIYKTVLCPVMVL